MPTRHEVPAATVEAGKPRRQWASGTDQVLAGMRYLGLFGELDMPSTAVLNTALASITGAGPHTRAGLTPRPGRRVWTYDPAGPVPVHRMPDSVVAAGNAAMLEHVRRRPDRRYPLEIHVAQRHIVLDIDHGLGDVSFALALLAEVFAHVQGGTTPWAAHDDTPLALPRALAHTFARHPARVLAVWKYLSHTRSRQSAVGETVPWSPSFAVTVVRVDAGTEAAVNDWRRAHAAESGSAAVWLYIVRQALRTAGIRMQDKGTVAFDCRRYLPDKSTVNSNFMCGVQIPLSADDTPPTIAARLREVTDCAVPLAGIGAVAVRALFSARQTVAASRRTVGAPAELFYSDVGRIASLGHLPWIDRDAPFAIGLLDPGSPDSITVLNLRIGTERVMSISFHDNVFDRQAISALADCLTDPIRFLTPTSSA